MSRTDDLRADYNRLGDLLAEAEPGEAAALVRERRLIGELLEQLETPEAVTFVDQLAGNVVPLESGRGAAADAAGAASRRRKSG